MDADLDPFQDAFDEPAVPKARPAGKFQSKARPRKGKAAAVAPPSDHVAANKPSEMVSDGNGGGGGDATLGDLDSESGKVAAEAGDIYLELDAIHDLVTQPTRETGVSVPSTNVEGIDEGPRSSSLVHEFVDSSEVRRSGMATNDSVAVDTDGGRLQSEGSGDFPDLETANVFSESGVASES